MDTKYILLVLGLLLLIAPGAALDGYAYNQSVSYSACDQSVYQQDLVIHRSAGTAYEETVGRLNVWHLYVGTDCQADYGDLRFTDATGTELSYYLWPDYDISSARFTVRLEGATAAGTLAIHYGNPTATTTSDSNVISTTYSEVGSYTYLVPPRISEVKVLVVGGGGGASGRYNGAGTGGGGAGGLVYTTYDVAPGTSIPVVIGAGGARQTTIDKHGNPGESSSFGDLVALGGGPGQNTNRAGNFDGGSGGGGGRASPGGAALQPASPSGGYGNPGGDNVEGSPYRGGGGGGSAAAGVRGNSGGTGGDGLLVWGTHYAAGGGGGGFQCSGGSGGSGGGGSGGGKYRGGTDATGHGSGGGGGDGNSDAAIAHGMAGSSGIVIIKIGDPSEVATPPAATAFLTGAAPETPPVAEFSASPTSGTAPLAVQFTDASTGTPTSWAWVFGDGGTSDQQHPSHTYNEPGTYTVSLTATNAYGEDTETKTGYITVYTPGPYSVATYADLCKVGTGVDGWTLDAEYIQTADIQCPTGIAQENFPRIGENPGEYFIGSYDGMGYEINDLYMNYADFHTGMVIVLGETGEIRNVSLTNVSVTTNCAFTGGLVGQSLGVIENCNVTGQVTGSTYTGMVVGHSSGMVNNCTAIGTVIAPDHCGGLIGSAAGTVSGSNSFATVVGSDLAWSHTYFGGLIGAIHGNCNVIDCNAFGSITADDSTGGLIGRADNYVLNIINSNAYGDVNTFHTSGGLIGWGASINVTNCSANGNVVCSDQAGGLIGYIQYGGSIVDSSASGSVGNTTAETQSATGGFIGHSYAENGLTISNSVATGGVSGITHVGGFIGNCHYITSVYNCYATGDIIVQESDFDNAYACGGFGGQVFDGSFERCYATGNVTGRTYTGGFIGDFRFDGASITECYATGNVYADYMCGGFLGSIGSGSVSDCYATGSVTAIEDVSIHLMQGGFIGRWSGGSIDNCYSTGMIYSPNLVILDGAPPSAYAIGGFGGDMGTYNSTNCYWDITTSGCEMSFGNATGKTTVEMQTITTFAGWNIAPAASLTDEVWQIVDGSTYPLFAWQDVPIGEQEPVAGFSADPVLGPAPLTVQFTDESTNEPTEWVWQFGDGATSFAQHPSHTYTEPGTYTVSLEAANSAGSDLVTEPDLITVQISDAVTFVGTPTTGGSPLTVRFTVVNGDPTWSYLWSFGDGETSTDQNPVHRYTTRADTANFTVTLTITQNGETETIERPDYIRIDTVGIDTFTATQQMNIESVVTVGAISSIIAGIIVVVFVL